MQKLFLVAAYIALVPLYGCGESEEEIYDRGYEAGYDDGQYDVCRELGYISESLKERLRNCRGF